MFERLQQEIESIKTPRFHVVGAPTDQALAQSSETFALPPDYVSFVRRFGAARLYRDAGSRAYRVGVLAPPEISKLPDGRSIAKLGFSDSASAFVFEHAVGHQGPVFEMELGRWDRVADSFESWLDRSCAAARAKIRASDWQQIIAGPEPFSPREQQIVDARQQFEWRVLDVNAAGEHGIEIINRSTLVLPVLTLGVRSRDRRLNGAVWIDVSGIAPGERAIIRRSLYRGLVESSELEVFEFEQPQPEDRESFRELQA